MATKQKAKAVDVGLLQTELEATNTQLKKTRTEYEKAKKAYEIAQAQQRGAAINFKNATESIIGAAAAI